MLAAAGMEPGLQLAFIENRQISVTAEKVAINAVMAGCKPEYMPVIVAAVEALADPLYGYHGPATSTGGSAVFMVVNGPIAKEIGMKSGDNLFGPGSRGAAHHAQRDRHDARRARPQQPGPCRQVHLLHRRERGQQPVAGVPHVARLPARPERGDDLRRARAAPVLEPALLDARRHIE